jgi:hypothetical protein
MTTRQKTALLVLLAALCASPLTLSVAEPAPEPGSPQANVSKAGAPLCISGVYPHLAVAGGDECGIGTLAPWAGKIWFSTYGSGGGGSLYSVDGDLRLQSHARGISGLGDRMIHRESNQLFIGSCAVDADGRVRRVEGTRFRGTACARHLVDPANKVYVYGMEGHLAEVDVHTLKGAVLFRVQEKGVTGAHGKGGYSGQGRLVVANNGGGGGLAEWDGHPDHPWTLLERKQFTDVTGPGGIHGPTHDDDPLWTVGWDPRSVILKVCDRRQWHTYRLPKASYTHDAGHGWFTEWPRIREVEPGRYLLDHHGMFYDFPKDFRPGKTAGLRPIATHLRMVVDWATWNGRLVMSHDDASALGSNGLTALSQSNLWFGKPEDLRSFGKPAGWGGPWIEDAVKAGEPSDPMLVDGFEKRVVHLAHNAQSDVLFTLEADVDGRGAWSTCRQIQVPAAGYAYYIFPGDFRAQWVRLKIDKNCRATAYFHFSSSGGPADGNAKTDIFRALAVAGENTPRIDGTVTHGRGLGMDFRARRIDAKGVITDAGHFVADEKGIIAPAPDSQIDAGKARQTFGTEPSGKGGKPLAELVLPKMAAESPYDVAAANGWGSRSVRSVITERNLANIQGTLYEVPFHGGMRRARPIATHGRLISDFCCWRGLLVLAGTRADAEPDPHFRKSSDGQVGLWFGKFDDLWHLGKPRGVGGPWHKTPVKADVPSAAYLMTGFDRKRVELSHDAKTDVTFTIEVDFTAAASERGSGSAGEAWHRYARVTAPPGQTVAHEFPDGFSAHGVRTRTDTACTATAWFVYE